MISWLHDFGVACASLLIPILLFRMLTPEGTVAAIDALQISPFIYGIAGFVALVGAAAAGVYRNFSMAAMRVAAEQTKLVVAGETQRANNAEVKVNELTAKVMELTAQLGILNGELNVCKLKLQVELDRQANSTSKI